ncbi:hypothetical protein [Acidovorax sp. NCPPB 4044]|uniref:hypothetical protein n=1 Tax=Acidovorax sp. NCPPB 4044 TaxID=2940490 RepID=UPI0023027328|nr:hypothetical protein [Acidovorax sp. NCPPB 4044]MDA8522175.1 hypothetical protein [Acidovorax sp. NCPPB 4044]
MKTDARMVRGRDTGALSSASSAAADAFALVPAEVVRVEPDGMALVSYQGREIRATLASQVPGVVAGQPVLAALGSGADAAELPALIVAAWPVPGSPVCPPWQFDRTTGSLALEVAQIDMAAVNQVVLRCGDARTQFTKDGAIETRAHQITSAAVETHRIEGGSIELN